METLSMKARRVELCKGKILEALVQKETVSRADLKWASEMNIGQTRLQRLVMSEGCLLTPLQKVDKCLPWEKGEGKLLKSIILRLI